MRIGIIGAGSAGLTAADTLRDRGYTDITILEASDRAGGKCSSFPHEGRMFELGAGVLSSNDRVALDLARKYNVAVSPVAFDASAYLDAETGQLLTESPLRERVKLLYQAAIRYRALCKKHRRIEEPGFDRLDRELAESFSSWAKGHGLGALETRLAPYFSGYGYGYFDEVSAAYVLKYYAWNVLRAYVKKEFYKFPDGIQGLWSRIAEENNVLFNTTIERVQRGPTVRVRASGHDHEFDRLILAAPLDDALSYLDASDEERALFSKITHYDYRTYACILRGFPKQNGYIPGNHASSRKGHPVFWYQRYQDSDLYTFYVIGDWKISDEEVWKNIERVVRPLGGTIERTLTVVRWKYFPHVSPDAMRDGYFDTIEALQGQRSTYYTGELLSFSTVGRSAAYSKHLVERFFEPHAR